MRRFLVLAALAGAVLASAAGAAERVGTPRAETIRGTARADYIDPRAGRDRVFAGRGADRVKAFDGIVDRISCGPGADVVAADLGDRVDSDCEIVSRRLAVDRLSDPESGTTRTSSRTPRVWLDPRRRLPGRPCAGAGGAAAAIGFSTTRERRPHVALRPATAADEEQPTAGEWARASDPVIAYSARARRLAGIVARDVSRHRVRARRSTVRRTESLERSGRRHAVIGRELGFDKQWCSMRQLAAEPVLRPLLPRVHRRPRGSRISLQTSSDGGFTWSAPIGSPDNAGRNVEPVARRATGGAAERRTRDRLSRRRPDRVHPLHRRRPTLSRAQLVASARPTRRRTSAPSRCRASTSTRRAGSTSRGWTASSARRAATGPTSCSRAPRRRRSLGADRRRSRSALRRPAPTTHSRDSPPIPRGERLALTYYRLTAAGAIDAFFARVTRRRPHVGTSRSAQPRVDSTRLDPDHATAR